jgi:hypothetical protein
LVLTNISKAKPYKTKEKQKKTNDSIGFYSKTNGKTPKKPKNNHLGSNSWGGYTPASSRVNVDSET